MDGCLAQQAHLAAEGAAARVCEPHFEGGLCGINTLEGVPHAGLPPAHKHQQIDTQTRSYLSEALAAEAFVWEAW